MRRGDEKSEDGKRTFADEFYATGQAEVAPTASQALELMVAELNLPSATQNRARERFGQLRTFSESTRSSVAPARAAR